MADKALRGRGLLGVGERTKKKKPIMNFGQEVNAGPNEALGIYVSGGIKGKPHSTKEGRIAAGVNFLNRAWGQKYEKKKGVKV